MNVTLNITMYPREESNGGLYQPGDHVLEIDANIDGVTGSTRLISSSTDDHGRMLDIVAQAGRVLAQLSGNMEFVIDPSNT